MILVWPSKPQNDRKVTSHQKVINLIAHVFLYFLVVMHYNIL